MTRYKIKQPLTLLVYFLFLPVTLPVDFAAAALSRAETESEKNGLPELVPIRIKGAGIGQRVFFGLGAIDHESDDVRVELLKKPESAKYNPKTLTVDWTPTKYDDPNGLFLVQVTEFRRDGGNPRTTRHTFNIPVSDQPVPLPELEPAPLEVEALISITDPERLHDTNQQWSIVKMFQRIAEIEAEKQVELGSSIKGTTGEALFREALVELAKLHNNDSVNPDSGSFDPAWNAEHWRLICLRPRINKKVFELRFVYFNEKAAEQVYLMPRMRIIRGKDVEFSEEIRQANNLEYIKLFHNSFFDGPDLKPFVAEDKAKYSKALAVFVTKYLNYSSAEHPQLKANFAALPHNARLGGDNRYDDHGNYLTGDGWALGAMKVQAIDREGERVLGITSPPIAGFVASIEPTDQGDKFKSVPAPGYVKGTDTWQPGWETLVSKSGTVAIPSVDDEGKVSAAKLDSASVAREHKQTYMVAETPLDDPRRRLFEEKGMTCIQCHVRNFDEGNYLKSVQKPGDDAKAAWPQRIPTVFFVITPTDHDGRSEYIRREEAEQVGNLKGVLRDYLGIEANITTPLIDKWPHETTHGRS